MKKKITPLRSSLIFIILCPEDFFVRTKKRGHAIGAASYVFCIIRLVSRSPHRPNPHLRIHREAHDLLPFLNTTYTLQAPQLWVC